MESRESLKNVSLGTSKINYLDPRCVPRAALAAAWYRCAEGRPPFPARSISVAWCKKHEVPIEKIYTKVLLEKFGVRFACVDTPLACATRDNWIYVPVEPQWSMETDSSFDF